MAKWSWWQKVLGALRVILDRAHDAGAIPSRRPTVQTLGEPRDLAGKK